MILILATSAIDATWFASTVLGLGAQEMAAKCAAVTRMSELPTQMPEKIYATPQFFERMMTPGIEQGTSWEGPIPRRIVSGQEARQMVAARGIRTTVRLRGGTIIPPYDVPTSMDPEAIEKWLNEG